MKRTAEDRRSSSYGKDPVPHINPQRIRPEDHSWLLEVNREQKYSDKVCVYCSSEKREIKHHHFSTTKQRQFMLKHSKAGSMCPICQKVEPEVTEKTVRRVIVSDSTMFGIWNQQELPNISQHMDLECIVDARIRHLTRAIRKNLLESRDCLHIIVIGGLKNVEDGQTAKEILEEFSQMESLMEVYKRMSSFTSNSYISFSTIPLAPKYCSFGVPKDAPGLADWVPGPTFKNFYPVIKEVNEALKAVNEKNGLSWLNLHLQGMKILKSGPQHKYDTRPGVLKVWRENAVFEKQHFTMANKLKLVKYMQNTFAANENKYEEVN